MTAPGSRKMTHPQTGAELTASADSIDMYLSQGWVLKSGDKPDPEKS